MLHPPLDSFCSGGNIYDQRLLEYAARRSFPLASLNDSAALSQNWDLLIWDSLLLDRVARIGRERIGLLLHYLPSLAPQLDLAIKHTLQSIEDRAMVRADFAIATGNTLASTAIARWPGKPVYLCEPGVNEIFVHNRPRPANRSVKLLTVAHLLPAKGHAELLDILERLRDLPWHWHIAGDCELSPKTACLFRNRMARADLSERITFHGAVPQETVAALMADSDILISPSTCESYGMTIAEAAASGLPVLSNRVGAAAKLIQHGVTGFLSTVGDAENFERYLEALLKDAALRDAFRHNLRQTPVRRWDQTFADFHSVCEAVLRPSASDNR